MRGPLLLLAGAVALSVATGCAAPAASRQLPPASAHAVGAERELSLEVQELT